MTSEIGNLCKRIQNLALAGTGTFAGISQVETSHFNSLRALELWSAETDEGTGSAAESAQLVEKLVKNGREIKNLLVYNFSACTDQVFMRILEVKLYFF